VGKHSGSTLAHVPVTGRKCSRTLVFAFDLLRW
jgi:hypothetical protein